MDLVKLIIHSPLWSWITPPPLARPRSPKEEPSVSKSEPTFLKFSPSCSNYMLLFVHSRPGSEEKIFRGIVVNLSKKIQVYWRFLKNHLDSMEPNAPNGKRQKSFQWIELPWQPVLQWTLAFSQQHKSISILEEFMDNITSIHTVPKIFRKITIPEKDLQHTLVQTRIVTWFVWWYLRRNTYLHLDLFILFDVIRLYIDGLWLWAMTT